ncbi:Type II secretion system protein F [Planctomycetes bacterium CA13]|uniref:Type II secretion system protein F n=1 Tax=Novipirellula herctigrandis TaxID=2527986 RepID=A0A5C5Z7X1_9BACT|nr:Type II secretion system protein F [Planctomycetes bacterium CA13]
MNDSNARTVATNGRKPSPEYELTQWVLQKLRSNLNRLSCLAKAPSYDALARFSHDLGTCVRSGVDIVRGLELCLKAFCRTRLGDCWSGAPDAVRRGSSLSDALSGGADYLPAFFLPVIKAGEQSGRLDEALEFLESHCRLLSGPAAAIRNLWVFPVAIMLMGSVLKVLLTGYLGSIGAAAGMLMQEVISWLQLILILMVVMMTPLRSMFDQFRLSLPWIGALEREIALHRFFRVLALLYSVSGQRVEVMIHTAAETVGNHAAKSELLNAADAIEQGHAISSAFQGLTVLTLEEKGTIEVGDLSGTLDGAFARISDDTGASLLAKIELIQPFLVRIVFCVVVFSIVITLFGLLS